MIYWLVIIIMVLVSLMLIGIILLQSSKSGGMGTAMGQNAMSAAFGGQGGDKMLVRTTSGLAGFWMLLALTINFMRHPDVESTVGTESIISQKAQPTATDFNPAVEQSEGIDLNTSSDTTAN